MSTDRRTKALHVLCRVRIAPGHALTALVVHSINLVLNVFVLVVLPSIAIISSLPPPDLLLFGSKSLQCLAKLLAIAQAGLTPLFGRRNPDHESSAAVFDFQFSLVPVLRKRSASRVQDYPHGRRTAKPALCTSLYLEPLSISKTPWRISSASPRSRGPSSPYPSSSWKSMRKG